MSRPGKSVEELQESEAVKCCVKSAWPLSCALSRGQTWLRIQMCHRGRLKPVDDFKHRGCRSCKLSLVLQASGSEDGRDKMINTVAHVA